MTAAIESNPRDNALRRFATFLGALAMFCLFLVPILLIVGFNSLTEEEDKPSPFVEARTKILEETRDSQAVVNEYGAPTEGKIAVAINDALPIAASRLLGAKGAKTDIVVPGSPTAMKGADTGGEPTELLEILAEEENKQ